MSEIHRLAETFWVPSTHYDAKRRNAIRWCTCTHNFFRGCSKISPGCEHCYASDEAVHQNLMKPTGAYRRLVVLRRNRAQWTGRVEAAGIETWTEVFRWTSTRVVFVNSMSDVFHANIPDAVILCLLRILDRSRWNIFQIVTKRAERMASFYSRLVRIGDDLHLSTEAVPFEHRAQLPNVWLGVSAEDNEYAHQRIPFLRETRPSVRFVSMEPLLGGVDLSRLMDALDWIIVGGESGGREEVFRPMDVDWARFARDFCEEDRVPFFFKQNAGLARGRLVKTLDGNLYEQLPRREVGAVPNAKTRKALIEWAEGEYRRVVTPWLESIEQETP